MTARAVHLPPLASLRAERSAAQSNGSLTDFMRIGPPTSPEHSLNAANENVASDAGP